HVEIYGGLAFATVGTSLQSYDLTTGILQQTLDFSGSNLAGMARENNHLYLMLDNVVQVVQISGLQMIVRGSLAVPDAGTLVVGNGIAYVMAATSAQGGYQ